MLSGCACLRFKKSLVWGLKEPATSGLVAEWMHFTLVWIIPPTLKNKSVDFLGLMNSATKTVSTSEEYVALLGGCRLNPRSSVSGIVGRTGFTRGVLWLVGFTIPNSAVWIHSRPALRL